MLLENNGNACDWKKLVIITAGYLHRHTKSVVHVACNKLQLCFNNESVGHWRICIVSMYICYEDVNIVDTRFIDNCLQFYYLGYQY